MGRKIFWFSFLLALSCQYIVWTRLAHKDIDMWASQAVYVGTQDSRQFDFTKAYAHPGATIIDGVLIVNRISGLSPVKSLIIFLSVFNSIVISLISFYCYINSKKTLWWAGALATFSLNNLFAVCTPPTAVSALLTVLLLLVSLYVYRQRFIKIKHLLMWTVVAGFNIATRVDVGIFFAIAFIILIKPKISLKTIIYLLTGVALIFIIINPYMWYMPLQHIKDLGYKILYHYYYLTPRQISISEIFFASKFAFISILLALSFIFIKKHVAFPLPNPLITLLGAVTFIALFVILRSGYQSIRYLIPFIFIWELLFPLFLLTLVTKGVFNRNILSVSIIALIAGSQILLSVFGILI